MAVSAKSITASGAIRNERHLNPRKFSAFGIYLIWILHKSVCFGHRRYKYLYWKPLMACIDYKCKHFFPQYNLMLKHLWMKSWYISIRFPCYRIAWINIRYLPSSWIRYSHFALYHCFEWKKKSQTRHFILYCYRSFLLFLAFIWIRNRENVWFGYKRSMNCTDWYICM